MKRGNFIFLIALFFLALTFSSPSQPVQAQTIEYLQVDKLTQNVCEPDFIDKPITLLSGGNPETWHHCTKYSPLKPGEPYITNSYIKVGALCDDRDQDGQEDLSTSSNAYNENNQETGIFLCYTTSQTASPDNLITSSTLTSGICPPNSDEEELLSIFKDADGNTLKHCVSKTSDKSKVGLDKKPNIELLDSCSGLDENECRAKESEGICKANEKEIEFSDGNCVNLNEKECQEKQQEEACATITKNKEIPGGCTGPRQIEIFNECEPINRVKSVFDYCEPLLDSSEPSLESNCIPIWECTDWKDCDDLNDYTRTCQDINRCGVICNQAPACIEKIECKNLLGEATINQIIDSAYNAVNHMEKTRLLPDSVKTGSHTLKVAQSLDLMHKAIELISENPDLDLETTKIKIYNINEPEDKYPAENLLSKENDELYSSPLTKEEYLKLSKILKKEIIQKGAAPEKIGFQEGNIRYPELVYLLGSILRYHKFYNSLPEFYSLHIISPKGLVPWEVPEGFEGFVSAFEKKSSGGSDRGTVLFYQSSAHHYDIFKLAKEIIGTEKDPYVAGELIYDWSKQDAYLDVGYYGFSDTPFGRFFSSSDWIKYRKGTSGTPRNQMTALMRSIQLPHSGEALYIEGMGWINAEIHASYGVDPTLNRFVYTFPPEPLGEDHPTLQDSAIEKIKLLSSDSTEILPSVSKAIFINPSDVQHYGADFIVDKVYEGGFDTIIITVKTGSGDIYFLNSIHPMVEDVLAPLIFFSENKNIKIYAALSVLRDYNTVQKHPDWKQSVDTWASFPPDYVSLCVNEYQTELKSLLDDLITNYTVEGIIFGSLAFSTSGGDDGNSYCDSYRTNPQWKEELVLDYVNELTEHVKNSCPTCDVRTLTSPIGPIFTANPSDPYVPGSTAYIGHEPAMGFQNVLGLSLKGDGIILPIMGNYWLHKPHYHFPEIVNHIGQTTERTPGVSFYLTDEWMFTPRFYNGVIRLSSEEGIDFVSFHSLNSLEGEFGPAFSKAQYFKISHLG
jgi:hypothetical protein